MNIKNWMVSSLNKEIAAKISEDWGIPFFLAMLLEIRGIHTEEEIREMLENQTEYFDPFLLADMEKAVKRIHEAVNGFEKIAIFGDYDADGVTSTAMLYSYLESSGANVIFYIPEREGEGYGLNTIAIDQLKEQQVTLIITVDNGISSVKEVEYATELGIDVVITDHHRPQAELPLAVAVVDPYREDCNSPFKLFSGVGVAFKLIVALEGEDCDLAGLLENYADLVAIGTIGDVVPLTGENRCMVRAGLNLLSRTDRVGLKALLEQAGIEDRKLTAGNVAFTIVPRINATGRIGSPDRAVKLLSCEDLEEAESLAVNICDDNAYRRQIESEIYESALEYLKNHPSRIYDRVLIVEGENWHHGVIGIVASRLCEKFGKPCMVISYSKEEAKGSGRSVEGFSLFEAVCACSQYLTKYGGHPMAAGLTMPSVNMESFYHAMNEYAADHFKEMPVPALKLDCKLNPAALSVEMPQQLESMEPFGTGNPSPLFGLYGMKLEEISPVGGGKHLRLTFGKKNVMIRCMRFHTTPQEFPYEVGDLLDLAVTLDAKPFRGENTLSIFIKDLKIADQESEKFIAELRCYEKFRRGEILTEKDYVQLFPNREEFAVIYRFLKSGNGWEKSCLVLLHRIGCSTVGLAKLLVILDVLEERCLIDLEKDGEIAKITVCPAQGKVDLFQSQVLMKIESLRAVR